MGPLYIHMQKYHSQFLTPITPCAAFPPRDIIVSCSSLFMCVSLLDYELLEVKAIALFICILSLSAQQSPELTQKRSLGGVGYFCAARQYLHSRGNVEPLFFQNSHKNKFKSTHLFSLPKNLFF